MSSATSRHDLLHSRLTRFTRMLHGVEPGDVRAIHRTRVASRRLRELLPVLQIDADVARKLGRSLRRIARQLGTVRELDVLLMLLDEAHGSRGYSDRALGQIAAEIRIARIERQEELSRKSAVLERRRVSRKLESVLHDLEDTPDEPSHGRSWRWAIEARVAHRAAALKDAIEQAGALYLPERLHVARIALKKLRYGVELSVEAAGAERGADLRKLKRVQDVLGRLHDLQLLIDRTRGVQASFALPDVGMWRDLDVLIMALEQNCRRLHARYVRERSALATICGRLIGRSARPSRHAAARRAG